MGKIGYGYGSEWHLLRMLGYHRQHLNQRVLALLGGDAIEWLDHHFSSGDKVGRQDGEWLGLDFISNENILSAWRKFWPQSGSAQNWDAVARVRINGVWEWLLVEAKAHTGEVESHLAATNPVSIETINSALNLAKPYFGENCTNADWTKKYYQFCNRLSVLYFLRKHLPSPVPARLLFIYFCGDTNPGANCPATPSEWQPTINAFHQHTGFHPASELGPYVHDLYLEIL